ncbi:MAG: protein kinase [Acidobacteria bacterium]|nr:protein kinase [Acidobacteriota bacterium]
MHIGSTISHYKIVEKLGEGGMGVVYKAEDTKLKRQVALKFLAPHLLSDEEAKERFLREAQAAAALHHPNVCPVHEIDEVDGKTFLAMAFLEGESLEERITEGPLSIKEALDIARQVAEGLDAAHEKGIVHRDIKPANVMVDAKGHATIMDFGLARLTEASRLTRVDTAMGTVAYMSPEQAQGMDVDSRSDIWSLGCVIYEMVAGQRPFLGEYDQALLYEIVHEEAAPLTSIRAGVPMELEFIVGECLAKDRDDRTSAGHEVARKLRTLSDKLKSGHSTILRTTPMTGAVAATMTGPQTLNPDATLPPDSVIVGKRKLRALQALAASVTIALLGLAFVHFTQAPPPTPLRRFSFAPDGFNQNTSVISPDGKSILYVAANSLWLRSLSDESAREIPGIGNAYGGFWSPDSLSIGFPVSGDLKRVSINGGDPITLCGLPQGFSGGTWSPDGERIVFSSDRKLYESSSRGGQPQLLLDAVGEARPVSLYPHFLPTGGGPPALVYSAAITPADRWATVLNLETGERRELGPGTAPVYSQDGYLIHGSPNGSEPGLWILPFSLAKLEPTGDAFPISTAGFTPSISDDGTLVYRDQAEGGGLRTLVWRNRAGELLETVGQPQRMTQIALSPDGERVALRSNESGSNNIWVQDLARSTKTRLTFEDRNEDTPSWSPSGQ